MFLRNLFLAVFFLLFNFFTFSQGITGKKVLPRSNPFFTHTENCYFLELEGVPPSKVSMEIPDFPSVAKLSSYKKEEFQSQSGEKSTILSFWLTFSETGAVNIPPLTVKINGVSHYFEFEKVEVHENPNFISPKLEVTIDAAKKQQNSNSYTFKKGEKIFFTLTAQYAVQILSFKWNLPQNSIFTEKKRFEFANGNQKLTTFTSEKKKLASFEWQILKEGTYTLPEFFIEALSFNGTKKMLLPKSNISIIISDKSEEKLENLTPVRKHENIFDAAFENLESESLGTTEKKDNLHSEYEEIAKNTKLSFFEKYFGEKQAIFTGGQIMQVPEEKSSGESFSGGKRVKISQKTKNWSFITAEEFQGWTKNDNLIEIK